MATARNGDDLAGGHETPRCNNLRLTLDSPPTTYGTSPVTVMLGGRYDPSPVKRISECECMRDYNGADDVLQERNERDAKPISLSFTLCTAVTA